MDSRLENLFRRAVKAKMKRGQQTAVAQAAGHRDGSWVSNWLSGAQRYASFDEIVAMARQLQIPLAKLLETPDGAEIDWEVFGLMGRVKSAERKRICRDLVAGLVDDDVARIESATNAAAPPSRRQVVRKSRRAG